MISNTYVFKVLLAIDTFFASLIWRDSAITISSYTGLELRGAAPARWAVLLGAFLDWINPGHCEKAIAHDIARATTALAILTPSSGKVES